MKMQEENGYYTDIDVESIFSVMVDLLCVTDMNGVFLKVSNSWTKALGYSIAEVEGKNCMDLIHKDDHQSTRNALKTLEAGEEVTHYINRFLHRDGSYLFFEWRAVCKGPRIYLVGRNISETVRLEKENIWLSRAIENSPVTVMITDKAGVLIYVNEKFIDLTGYEKEEAIGNNPRILNSGAQNKAFYQELWKTITSGKTWRGTFHNKKKNGELYWEWAHISPVFDEEGRISRYVAIKQDITAQKEAEDALRKSNDLLDLFFQQSLDGFFFMMLDEPVEWNDTIDKEKALEYVFAHQRITNINEAMLDQYGAEEVDFIGLTPNDFFVHDIVHGKKIWKKFFDDGHLHIDTDEQKFDGTPMKIEGDYICIYDDLGKVSGHFGVQRDVTFEREALKKLEESEKKFRQLANNIDQVFFLRTADELLYVSPAYENIWGVSIDSLFKNPDSFLDSVHPDDREEVFYKYKNALENFSFEYRIIRPDGDIRWVFAKTFLVDDSRKVENRRVAGIAQDITERKKLEDKLREISIRDPLTGLYNRRHIVERVEPLVEKVRRDKTLFSLAILDIDHFKHINDTYGHVAGDQVLKAFSEILHKSIRAYDLAGRFGGEEFILIFMDINRKQAGELVTRILDVVRNTSVPYDGEEISFTFSCGIADATNCSEGNCSVDWLINEADQLLYKAKSGGRNRVLT